MNCHETHALWDHRLDGDLSDDQAKAFQEHLDSCPDCRDLWRGETQWLACLAEASQDQVAGSGSNDQEFGRRVLARWRHRRWAARAAVVGGWMSAAAALVLTAWLGWPRPVVIQGPEVTAQVQMPTASDPVSVLVLDLGQQIGQQPQKVRQAIEQTTSYLDLGRIVGWVGLGGMQGNPAAKPLPGKAGSG